MQSTKEAGHIVTNYGERLTTSPREILIDIQLRDPSLYRVRVDAGAFEIAGCVLNSLIGC